MIKKLLLFATAFLFNIGVQAQTDVTSQYIPNAGFEECEALPIVVHHDNYNNVDVNVVELYSEWNVAKGTDYETQGWKLVEQQKNANGGVVTYGCNIQSGKYATAGEPGPEQGVTGEKGLCFTGAAGLVYQQTDEITLPAGSYRLTVNLYARNGQSSPGATQQVTNVRTGFMPTGGTDEDLIPGKRASVQFASNAWDQDILDIELTEATTGRFQVCYGSSYYVIVDDLKLEYAGSVITTALAAVIDKAAFLNVELGNSNLAAAIEAARAMLADPTSQEDVDNQTEALYEAMAAAIAASGMIVDITSTYLENASFETGKIEPWTWGSNAGTVGEPINTESIPYIDGQNIVEFATNGNNSLTQTVGHLPAGYYVLDARLNLNATLMLGDLTAICKGGTDALYLRMHTPILNHTEYGELLVGAKSSTSFRIDQFRLLYCKNESMLMPRVHSNARSDMQSIINNSLFDVVTGSERTALQEAIDAEGDDYEQLIANMYAAVREFVAAKESYTKLVKAKETAAAYTEEAYPYAKKEIHEQIQEILATAPTTAANAEEMAVQLTTACFNLYVSNAYCEGVANVIDYTAIITAANATGTAVASAWHKLNMEIRTDKTAWQNPKTSESDKNVYGVTADYYRNSNEKNSYMWQTLSALPKGKYVLSAVFMAPTGVSPVVTINDHAVGQLTGVGMYGGGVYGGGWVENVITFDKEDDLDMKLQLQYTGSANYQEWYFDNLRLYCIDAEPVQDEPEYGIVGDFSSWDDDLMMTKTEEGTYTLTIADLEVREPKTFEYKLRADKQWGVYELPAPGSNPQNYSWTPEKSGFYTLNFVFNPEEHSLVLDAERTDDCTWSVTYVNVENWPAVYAYTFTSGEEGATEYSGEWPGTQLEANGEQEEGHDIYAYSLKSDQMPAFIIFNNGEGGVYNQTFDLPFEDGKQYNDGAQEQKPATAINSMNCQLDNTTALYDLQGRRVARTSKGIYIVNGKKIVIK